MATYYRRASQYLDALIRSHRLEDLEQLATKEPTATGI